MRGMTLGLPTLKRKWCNLVSLFHVKGHHRTRKVEKVFRPAGQNTLHIYVRIRWTDSQWSEKNPRERKDISVGEVLKASLVVFWKIADLFPVQIIRVDV